MRCIPLPWTKLSNLLVFGSDGWKVVPCMHVIGFLHNWLSYIGECKQMCSLDCIKRVQVTLTPIWMSIYPLYLIPYKMATHTSTVHHCILIPTLPPLQSLIKLMNWPKRILQPGLKIAHILKTQNEIKFIFSLVWLVDVNWINGPYLLS